MPDELVAQVLDHLAARGFSVLGLEQLMAGLVADNANKQLFAT